MAILTSWAAGVAGALVAGAIWLLKRNDSEFVAEHARAALNFNTSMEGDKDVDDPPDRSGSYPGGLGGNLLVLSPQAFSGSHGRACRFLEDCALFVVDFPHVERVRQAT